MSKKDVAIVWIVLLLCHEMRMEPIAEPGPSSGIMIQEAPGFILTEKRILTQRVFVSLDPKISIEKQYNVSSMQLPELKAWYQMHLERAQRRVQEILEQARKPFVSSSITMNHRAKRFLVALIVALVCTAIGAVVATGMSAANAVSVQTLENEIRGLKGEINAIYREMERQREYLVDLMVMVNDTIVTTNMHSKLISHSINLHQSHEQFKRELLSMHDPIIFHTTSFLDEVQSGMTDLTRGHISLYFVSETSFVK
ncbi:uncharacterized protein LOC128497788 [Spea bombifrons]|uniref:uncharacterized protein LOC128497788 n=1 Tax=Spea bombifrons TaxID=233779 RepID=UPI00234BFAA7|nr:uncharacterized protein LOC128497788 [Spea bombifrons]